MDLFLLQWRQKQIERGGVVMVTFNFAKKVGFDAYVDKLNGHLIRNYFAYIHTSDVR